MRNLIRYQGCSDIQVEIFCFTDLAGFLLKLDSTITNTEAKVKSLLKKRAQRSLIQIWSRSIFADSRVLALRHHSIKYLHCLDGVNTFV